MAGVLFTVKTTAGMVTGVAEHCVLQIGPRANQRVLVKEFSISFGGDDLTEDPILVEWATQSDQAGSGSGAAVTPKKVNQSDDETIQTVALESLDGSTQPTRVATHDHTYVNPTGGIFRWRASKEQPPIPVKGGQFFGIIVTAGQTNPVAASMLCEE